MAIYLQVSQFKWHVRVFPSRLEFSSNFFHVGSLFLGFKTPENPKQLPRISGVLFEIGTKHSFRPTCFAVQ